MDRTTGLNDSCYIILHRDRSSDKDRTRNLIAVINHIKTDLDIPVLVVEQDKNPDYDLSQIILDKGATYQFLYNPGLFNRSWGYNCAVNFTRFEKLILADNDVVLNNNDLKLGLNFLDNYDIVKPFKNLYDLTIENTIDYINGNKNALQPFKKRVNLTAGTLMMIKRSSFLKLGGYDERFEGWGGEDDEMTINIWKYVNSRQLTYYEFGENLFHLHHSRSNFDGLNQPNYKNNYKYIKDGNRNKNIKIGQLNKYFRKTVIVFKAYHKNWESLFCLYDDNTFEGGGNKPNGTWIIDSKERLVLRWYYWPEDILEKKDKGYCNSDLLLVFSFLKHE